MYAVWEGKRLNEILEEAIQDLLDRRIREAERTMEKTEKGDLSLTELELLKQQRKLKTQRVDSELEKKSGLLFQMMILSLYFHWNIFLLIFRFLAIGMKPWNG